MPVEVILPKVDMDMTHGTLAVWHVAPGDEVAKGAALFDIETDKAAMEVESPASGRLHAVSAKPGDKIAVGTVVALIYSEGENTVEVPPPPVAVAPVSGPQPIEVILPKVDMDMSHGTLAVWHVAEGDSVTKGTALFDIETDKAAMEVEAPATGTLHHLMAAPGDKVPVGDVVAYIYPPGMAVGPRPSRAATATLAEQPPNPSAAAPIVAAKSLVNSGFDGNMRATPAARAAARQAGLTWQRLRAPARWAAFSATMSPHIWKGIPVRSVALLLSAQRSGLPSSARCMSATARGQASRWFCFMALLPTASAGRPLKRRLALIIP